MLKVVDEREQLRLEAERLRRLLAARDKAIEQLQQRHEQFLHQTDLWFWETDPTHTVVHLSANYQQLAGVSPKVVIGNSLLHLAGEQAETSNLTLLHQLEAREPFRAYRYTQRDVSGALRHSAITGWPVYDAEGTCRGYRGIGWDETRDIEIREKAAQLEREMSARVEQHRHDLETVIDNMTQSILWFDRDRKLRLYNKQTAQLHNLSDRDLAAVETLDDYIRLLVRTGHYGEVDVEALVEMRRKYLFEVIQEPVTIRRHFPGTGRHFETRIAPSPDGGRIISEIDVTEQVKAEQALEDTRRKLEESNQMLEHRVKWRTREVERMQASLVEAERLATLGKLTATLSHELRNPLNALNTSLYIIKSHVGNEPKLASAFERSQRTIRRCSSILSDLHDFAVAEDIKPSSVDICAWVRHEVAAMTLLDSVSIEFGGDATGPQCLIDERQMSIALRKVVENALQAVSAKDRPLADRRVSISTAAVDGRLQIVVADTGPGMNEEVLGRAFEPFFSNRNFGVGLGLPIARQTLKRHGGGIELASVPGQGTTVTLWLHIPTERQVMA